MLNIRKGVRPMCECMLRHFMSTQVIHILRVHFHIDFIFKSVYSNYYLNHFHGQISLQRLQHEDWKKGIGKPCISIQRKILINFTRISKCQFGFLNDNSDFYFRIQCQCGFLLVHNYLSNFVNVGLNDYYYLEEVFLKVKYFKNYKKCVIMHWKKDVNWKCTRKNMHNLSALKMT